MDPDQELTTCSEKRLGRSINTSTAYSWNVTITADLTGSLLTQNPTIQYVLPGDLLFGTTPSVAPGVLSIKGYT